MSSRLRQALLLLEPHQSGFGSASPAELQLMRRVFWPSLWSDVGLQQPLLEVRLRAVWMGPPPLRYHANLGSRYEFQE